jgi:hypothetical protein
MLEIGELSMDKFRGIFKLTYNGDAYIVLQTKVQANPVNERRPELSISMQSHIVAADTPLVVPMQLRISDLKLRGFVALVVCRRNGVTLSFKNDPLEQVKVSSTFDGMASVKKMLQQEIEKLLRTMFQEELPSMVHHLSKRYLERKQTQLHQPVMSMDTSVDVSETTSEHGETTRTIHRSVRFGTSQSTTVPMQVRSRSADGLDATDSTFMPGTSRTTTNGTILSRRPGLRALAETHSVPEVDAMPRVVHSSHAVHLPTHARHWSSDAVHYTDAALPPRARTTTNSPNHSRYPTRPTSPLSDERAYRRRSNDLIQLHPSLDETDEEEDSFFTQRERHQFGRGSGVRPIVLQPGHSRHAAQLATLLSTNHTLSPYTRPVGHVATRTTVSTSRPDGQTRTSRRRVVGKVHLPWASPTEHTRPTTSTSLPPSPPAHDTIASADGTHALPGMQRHRSDGSTDRLTLPITLPTIRRGFGVGSGLMMGPRVLHTPLSDNTAALTNATRT